MLVSSTQRNNVEALEVFAVQEGVESSAGKNRGVCGLDVRVNRLVDLFDLHGHFLGGFNLHRSNVVGRKIQVAPT